MVMDLRRAEAVRGGLEAIPCRSEEVLHLEEQSETRQFVTDLVRILVSKGRTPEALGEAARWGRIDLVDDLLKAGLDVDQRDRNGITPLMYAASGGQTDVV